MCPLCPHSMVTVLTVLLKQWNPEGQRKFGTEPRGWEVEFCADATLSREAISKNVKYNADNVRKRCDTTHISSVEASTLAASSHKICGIYGSVMEHTRYTSLPPLVFIYVTFKSVLIYKGTLAFATRSNSLDESALDTSRIQTPWWKISPWSRSSTLTDCRRSIRSNNCKKWLRLLWKSSQQLVDLEASKPAGKFQCRR